MACPPLSIAAIRRISFTCSPPLRQIVVHWSQLEEVTLVHFRLRGPDVIYFDAQGTNNSNGEPCLL